MSRNKHKHKIEAGLSMSEASHGFPPVPKDNPVTKLMMKEKTKVCPRCGGDGFWHSTKTGYRAKTSSEPLIDKSRKCPECKG